MAILLKACETDNFELHNSLMLSFTNIWGLCSNFVDCESFLESNSPDILALCETNLDDSIDSGNFSVRGYLPSIRKDSSTHIRGLAVYVKEGLPFKPSKYKMFQGQKNNRAIIWSIILTFPKLNY